MPSQKLDLHIKNLNEREVCAIAIVTIGGMAFYPARSAIQHCLLHLQLHHLGADHARHLFQLFHDLIRGRVIHAQNHELRLAFCYSAHMHAADVDLSLAQNHAAGADDIGPVLDDGHHHVSLGGDVGMVLVELDDALLLARDRALEHGALVPLGQPEGDGIAVSVGRLGLAFHELDSHLL